MSASPSSTTSNNASGVNASDDPMVLLQHLEVGAALLELMFTIRRINEELVERKNHDHKTTSGAAPIRRNHLSTDGGSKALDDERFTQNLTSRLFSSLEVLDACSNGSPLDIDMKKLYGDENLTFLLAWAISEQAAMDDHIAAAAMENGTDLPAMTECQTVVQTADFAALLGDGDPDLGTVDRCEAVIWAFVKQCDIDVNRESFAWKNGGSILDKTNCQVLFERQYFRTLFDSMKNSYYQNSCSEPILKWNVPWWDSEEPSGDTELPRVECVGCCDAVLPLDCLQASCDHYFCEGCVITLAGICIKDESSFPMKCCTQPMKPSDVIPFLDQNLRTLYAAACLEFGTPAGDRVYCPQPKCSVFLGSAVGGSGSRRPDGATLTCQNCRIAVCTGCKEKAHPGEGCEENKEMQATRKLAEEQNWKACPKCRAIVEKTEGCNHMVCRCTEEFCYRCGVLWRPRTCNC